MHNNRKMKWWGWGDVNVNFDISNRPSVWPFIIEKINVQPDSPRQHPVAFENIQLEEPIISLPFIKAIKNLLQEHQYTHDKHERLIHAYGKSFRDLWRIRRGIVEKAPDTVIYPQSEDEITNIIQLAKEFNVIIIPFGGGSNIAGSLEPKNTNNRMTVSLDLSRLNKILSVDSQAHIAKIQAGAFGPDLEEQLNEKGFTLGHFPDSFQFSTLGGWVATRSAGMQSDRYGKIEDMVISLRMVTPEGTIITRDVPRSANGIDINRLCIGSEGILGVITEVTVAVRPLPNRKDYYGYLFPNFTSGVNAIHDCARKDLLPVMTRLLDPGKTALTFAFKPKLSPIKTFLGHLMKVYLRKIKRFDIDQCCFMITCYEGDNTSFLRQRFHAEKIFKQNGAISLGTSPGRAFADSKYDFPYIRDLIMDYNMIADVSETATTWGNLMPLYDSTMKAIRQAISSTGSLPWTGCHLSHNYKNGASLYFTFACKENKSLGLQQYLTIKKAAEDSFINNGATLSHHHSVGYEHMPWITKEISPAGVKAVTGIKNSLDPTNIMNPGKIIPTAQCPDDWGLHKTEKELVEIT